jgi:hypothetical protein
VECYSLASYRWKCNARAGNRIITASRSTLDVRYILEQVTATIDQADELLCLGDCITARGGDLLAFTVGFYIPTIQTQEDNLGERMIEKAQAKFVWKDSLAD